MSKEIENQSNIDLPEEIASGVYSNLAVVMHSQSEFVIDFIQLMPQRDKAKVRSRVILTPDNMKRLSRIIQENLHNYEREHGMIQLPEDFHSHSGSNSNTPKGSA